MIKSFLDKKVERIVNLFDIVLHDIKNLAQKKDDLISSKEIENLIGIIEHVVMSEKVMNNQDFKAYFKKIPSLYKKYLLDHIKNKRSKISIEYLVSKIGKSAKISK